MNRQFPASPNMEPILETLVHQKPCSASATPPRSLTPSTPINTELKRTFDVVPRVQTPDHIRHLRKYDCYNVWPKKKEKCSATPSRSPTPSTSINTEVKSPSEVAPCPRTQTPDHIRHLRKYDCYNVWPKKNQQ